MDEAARSGSLWAIASYYNARRSVRRRINYSIFRSHLPVPLLTVELSSTGDFELTDNDADLLVRIGDGDVLWQKERLLNVALDHLPADCDKVVWLDTDIVFGSDDWPERLTGLLEHHPLVHALCRAMLLPPMRVPEDPAARVGSEVRPSIVAAVRAGLSVDAWMRSFGDADRIQCSVGYAWAAPRALLAQHRLYDGCIIGGGDRALLCAAYGSFDLLMEKQHMNPQQRQRYLDWALSFHRSVGGHVGFLEGDVFHLWHGEAESRRYADRHADLSRLGFDPFADLALSSGGAWRWDSDKPELHRLLDDYFLGRHEAEEVPVEIGDDGDGNE